MWTQLFTPTQPCFHHFRGHQTDIHVCFRGEIRISGVWRTSWSNGRHFGACSVVAGYPDQNFGSHALVIVYIVGFKRGMMSSDCFESALWLVHLSFILHSDLLHAPSTRKVSGATDSADCLYRSPFALLKTLKCANSKCERNKEQIQLYAVFFVRVDLCSPMQAAVF